MTKYSYIIRKAHRDDLVSFLGYTPRNASRAWVVVYRDEVVCLAGVEFQPFAAVLFSEIKEGLDVPKISIWRATKDIMKLVKGLNRSVIAICRDEYLNSEKMLRMFGFTFLATTEQGAVYKWQH